MFLGKGKKNEKGENDSKDYKKTYIIIIIIITAIIICIGIGINIRKHNKNNDKSTSSNNEIIKMDDTVIGRIRYNFTLEDVKRSMDNTCKQYNINNYTDFEDLPAETEMITYISYKNAEHKENDERIEIDTVDNYVLSIRFIYPDSEKDNVLAGEENIFFNILKDNGTDEYANKVKEIITNLPIDKNEYYNNTLCYKGYFYSDKVTEYSVSPMTDESYNETKERHPEMFNTNEAEENENINKIDKSTFINNLSSEDKEHIKTYLDFKFKFADSTYYVASEEDSFIEDRFDIIGNDIIYTYLQANKLKGWDRAGGYNLIVSYFSVSPISDIPNNWKELEFSDLPNYMVVAKLNTEQVASLSGTGTADEELEKAKKEANTKIEKQLNVYREKINKPISKEGLKNLGELYSKFLYSYYTPELEKDGFSTGNLRIGGTSPKWNDNILDRPEFYCKTLENNKVLYITYFKSSQQAHSYKEKDYKEYYALGCLVDVNVQNMPLYLKNKFDTTFLMTDMADLFVFNCLPEPSDTVYYETSIENVYGGYDCEQVADKLINNICEHFGV